MTIAEAKDKVPQKLVNNAPLSSLDTGIPRRGLTKRRTRRIAEPHLRAHKVKGHVYYCFCRGIDKEIYLGDADAILKAVKKTVRIRVNGQGI